MTINELKDFWSAQQGRQMLWSPAGLMIGIAWYFSFYNEPSVLLGPLLLVLGILIFALGARYDKRAWVLPILLITIGFCAAQFRAHTVATPLIKEQLFYRELEGTIDEIDPAEKRIKLVLSHLVVEDLAPQDTPTRLRISLHDDGTQYKAGDRVRMIATIFPLPQPVMPGSYDFAQHFFFQRIGGNGFAMTVPEVTPQPQQSSWQMWLNNLRHSIGEDMRKKMEGAVGTVATAMTVGEQGPIPETTKEQLRDSGLSHMLSISGVHLSIAAGVLFFHVRFLLALWPAVALRFPIKKIAAAFAVFGAFVYLLLAGSPVPAQRSFIMVAVVFLGYILDRQSISLRTLAVAALFILLIFPDSMFGASFQLSFAATLAIVALYERFGYYLHVPNVSIHEKIYRHVLGIACSSLAATLATAPFVLYDFNRFAIFGVISNMMVLPLATFVIMPGVVLSLLFMPFGLQWIGYIPLKFGTGIMLWVGEAVAKLPYASLYFPSSTAFGMVLCTLGLLWVCLMAGRWFLLGVCIIIIGLSTMLLHESPDILISPDAKQVMVRLDDGRYTLLKGTAKSFTVKNWLRSEGLENAIPIKNSGIKCSSICAYTHNNYSVTFLKEPANEAALTAACAQKYDLLIAWRNLDAQTCKGPKHLIGRLELQRSGAHAVYMQKDIWKIERTRDHSGQRLWQLPFAVDEPIEN